MEIIGLSGYARTGKDEVAKVLVEYGEFFVTE
jgi:dephospho-CoA kinase